MVIRNDGFQYASDILFPFLKMGFRFLFSGHLVNLLGRKENKYMISRDGSKLENLIRDDILREAQRLHAEEFSKNPNNELLRFKFANERRDITNEEDIKRIDISITYSLIPLEPDIIIECKRLRKNEKNLEYLKNGIQRFISGRYGGEEDLRIAGMIGFIEQGEITSIVKDINKKIAPTDPILFLSSFSMFDDEELSFFSLSKEINESLFKSSHNREKDIATIDLFHMMLCFENVID